MFNSFSKKLTLAATTKSSALQKAQMLYAEMENSDPEQTQKLWLDIVDCLNKFNVGYEVLDPSQPDAEKVEAEMVRRVRESYLCRAKASYGMLMEMSQEQELEKIRGMGFRKAKKIPFVDEDPLREAPRLKEDLEKSGVYYDFFCTSENNKTPEMIEEEIDDACRAICDAITFARYREAYETFCSSDALYEVLKAQFVLRCAEGDSLEKIFPENSEPRNRVKTKEDLKAFCYEFFVSRAKDLFYNSLEESHMDQEDVGDRLERLQHTCCRYGFMGSFDSATGFPVDPSKTKKEVVAEAYAMIRQKKIACPKSEVVALRPNAMKKSGLQKRLEQ